MAYKKLGVLSIMIIALLSLPLYLIYQKLTAPLPPTFTIAVIPQEKIDPDLQINLVFSHFPQNGKTERKSYTLLHNGVIYPTNRTQDYPIFEIFIHKGDQFAYIGQENIFFAPDRSHPRAKFDRYAKLSFSPEVINNQIPTLFQQFHDGIERLNSESLLDLSSYYRYPKYPTDNEATLSDFTEVHHDF